MIEYLKIADLALLDKAQIEFREGFTAVTGETGAGKSVLLGALSMLAGNKCSKEVVRAGADCCCAEAVLHFSDTSKIDAYLEQNGVPSCEDGALVLSRSIHRQKSARAFVNGALVSQAVLAGLGEFWVDFHGPGEPQKLFSASNQLSMLDAFSDDTAAVSEYISLLRRRAALLREIAELKCSKGLAPDEIEFLKTRIAAIDKVNPTEESVAELEENSRIAEMASDIVEKSSAIYGLLSGESGAGESVAAAVRLAGELEGAGERAEALARRLESASVEIADIADEYESLARSCDMSEERIADIREKMSAWLSLARSYGASAELVQKARAEMRKKIDTQSDVKSSLEKLAKDESEICAKMKPIASAILEARRKGAKKLSASVAKMLPKLGFKNAEFDIKVEPLSEPSADCGSACEFRFCPNPGQPLLPLAKIASSGELARVMLALKATLADADSTPLLVFDEVDANVGGEIGAEVGRQLAALAGRHQVLCVTHLPQVAACAAAHLLVEKRQTKNSTSMEITSIGDNEQARVSELARMLGDRNSDSAIAHARKLLDKSL